MAIDHARDYLGEGIIAQNPTSDEASGLVYLTRLITHLCAPIFVFLAGTSAGLMTARRSPKALAKFLVGRGIWLILIELLIVSQLWSFNVTGMGLLGGKIVLSFQVIGAIGLSMVAVGIFQLLGARWCLIIGLLIIFGHNILDPIWPTPQRGSTNIPYWVALHTQVGYSFGPISIFFAYPPLAWIGIMLAGFGSASLFTQEESKRNQTFLLYGAGMILLFLILRITQFYGEPNIWETKESLALTVRDFFIVTKYPPSLLFTLLTLGIGCLLFSFADRFPKTLRSILITYGKAPFAIYIAHLFIIHCLSIALGVYQDFEAEQLMTLYFLFPQGFGVGLLGVYVFWLLIMISLYPLAKWVSEVKARRKDWWLSYL